VVSIHVEQDDAAEAIARADAAEAALAECREAIAEAGEPYRRIRAELAKETERLKRAYTLLCSVQPAAHRQTLASTNDTALRLHWALERAIGEWLMDYTSSREDPSDA